MQKLFSVTFPSADKYISRTTGRLHPGPEDHFWEGRQSHSRGVGLVALSLAVLFDTLAEQVRGKWVSESGPIPGLFVKDPTGYYPPHVYMVSKYLRLVPHIANNPTRMREESER